MVKHVSTTVAVMYLGKLVEITGGDELYRNPLHPYTKALLSAIPIPDPRLKRERVLLSGDVQSPIDPPPGCRFCARCPAATEICSGGPYFWNVQRHHVACHLIGGCLLNNMADV